MSLAHSAGSTLISTYHALNDAEPFWVPKATYSTIRHTRPWVYYQGASTLVPITVLGSKPLPEQRKIKLQRRGWRTGLLGWTVGGWLGGTLGKEIDVTPEDRGRWAVDVGEKQRKQLDKEIHDFLSSSLGPSDHQPLETSFIRIPVASGDGYFRFVIYPSPTSHTPITYTATFRVGSLSMSSANPRGASPITLIPELVLRSASFTTLAAFYAAFPIIKVAELIPGPTGRWGKWAMDRAWYWAGGEQKVSEAKERLQLDERKKRAETSVYKNVPFGSVGVRTAYDLEEDSRRGRGGVYIRR